MCSNDWRYFIAGGFIAGIESAVYSVTGGGCNIDGIPCRSTPNINIGEILVVNVNKG